MQITATGRSCRAARGTYTFVYNAENRLDYYTAPSMSSAYSYNGMGLRVAESDSGSGEHNLINDGGLWGHPDLGRFRENAQGVPKKRISSCSPPSERRGKI